MEHEGDSFTNHCWRHWINPEGPGKETVETGKFKWLVITHTSMNTYSYYWSKTLANNININNNYMYDNEINYMYDNDYNFNMYDNNCVLIARGKDCS